MKKNKLLIVGIFAFPLLLMIVLICIKLSRNHAEQEHYSHLNIAPYEYSYAVKHLSNFKFISVEEGDAFRQELNQIKVIDMVKVNPSQAEALKDSLHDLTMAFHAGTYDAYRKFRTPIEASFNEKIVSYHKTILEKFYKKPGEIIPDEPEAIMRLIWERDFGGNAFSNYWQQITMENASITYEELGKMPADLQDIAAGQINLGLFEIPSTFTFAKTPEILLKENGKVLFATAYFVFRPAPPDPPTPFRIRYYWDVASGKWLPWQMVSSNANKRSRDPFF